MSGLAEPAQSEAQPVEDHQPAVTARKSLASRDFIASLIDGKPYRSLKRHLTGHGLTCEEYRVRYNLRSNYPIVAPGYSEARRELAKRLSLGRELKFAEAPPSAKPAPKPRAPKAPAAATAPTDGAV